MSRPLIVDISLARRDFAVDVAFTARGQTAITGPSGSGKSTVLRAVAGLVPIDDGVIAVGDAKWSSESRSLPPELRSVGYMPQDAALFPHMTAAENVAYPLLAERLSRRARRLAAVELLRRFGLGRVADVSARRLSGGQRLRTAQARALIADRAVYLFDEPFAGLDRANASRSAAVVADLLATRGAPALVVGHDDELLAQVCKLSVRIEAGRLVDARPTASVTAAASAALAHGRAPARSRESTARRPACSQESSR